jgi:alkylated DNA nucleotide flippase Atl1
MNRTATHRNEASSCSIGRRLGLLTPLVLFSSGMPACVTARPLTLNELKIRVEPDDPNVTAELQRECRPVAGVATPDTAEDLRHAVRTLAGDTGQCARTVETEDDLRRCAGEHQAQVAQVVGADQHARAVGEDLEARDLTVRFWKCPASRAEIKPGELVWRRKQAVLNSRLQLIKDGQVVAEEGDYSDLSTLVAAHPPAFEYAKRAEDRMRGLRIRAYVSLPLAALAAAGGGFLIAGVVKHDKRMEIGGLAGAVVFTSASLAVLVSGGSSAWEATTDAMNAVDLYNDEYIRGKVSR